MNQFKMSLFLPPISPVKDSATGRTIQPPTLTPYKEITLQEVYKLITSSERLKTLTETVRRAAENGDEKIYRMLKQQTLPYVTPCGVFTRRRSDCIEEASGLVVVDIDHLESTEEAEKLRQLLFDDPYLCPALVFVSPTGQGVRALRHRAKCYRWNPLGHELCALYVRHRPPAIGKRSGYVGKRPRTLLFPMP